MSALLDSSRSAPVRLSLTASQEGAVDAISAAIVDTATKIALDPRRRRDIALAQGVTLLTAPTGAGKTLMIGRAIEAASTLPAKVVWLWFAPFSGLVTQASDAIMAQCPGLRVRDLAFDRVPEDMRNGDIFFSTWAAVASGTPENRAFRRGSERAPSVDLLLEALRAEGWMVGVVIDEAHVNFGQSAKEAASFYKNVAAPDFTVLGTATPRDADLEAFERAAGIGRLNRVSISRGQAVLDGLNKVGVKAVKFRPEAREGSLVDLDEITVLAAVERHRRVKGELRARGLSVTPLLMIQVENDDRGGKAQTALVRRILAEKGFVDEAVAVHTAAQQDPYFHMIAFDETVEVLVFKLAAATGFDAPRAWCLASLRRSTTVEFGLQVIGRIMRVHYSLQPLHPSRTGEAPGLVDFGYVFLSNPDAQAGLEGAATQIRAIHDEISKVTDNVLVVDFGSHKAILTDPKGGFHELLRPDRDGSHPPVSGSEPGSRAQADAGLANEALDRQFGLDLNADPSDGPTGGPRPRTQGDDRKAGADEGPAEGIAPFPGHRIRREMLPSWPFRLAREVMPRDMDSLSREIANRLDIDAEVLSLVRKVRTRVSLTEADVFGTDPVTSGTMAVPLSAARIVRQAQVAFRFNENLDERDLKRALVDRLRSVLDRQGHEEVDENTLRRAVDLIAVIHPRKLHAACAESLTQVVEIRQDAEVPEYLVADRNAPRSRKNVYGVMPPGLNVPETEFAQMLDDDETGTVRWWLRNVSQARWAVSIVLPNGRSFYPDFVVGVDASRKTPDHIGLVEVKDNGETGRMFASANTEKVRTRHRTYSSALMICKVDDEAWYRIVYRPDIARHQLSGAFSMRDLRTENI